MEENNLLQGEEHSENTLIFPVNVHDSLSASSGMSRTDKQNLIISFWVVICFIVGFVFAGWVRGIVPNHYVLLTILLEVALQLTVGAFLLRILLDENTLISEHNGNNSFAQYFHFYRERISNVDTSYPFDVIEFKDGSYAVYIRFLFGYSTDSTMKATAIANKKFISTLNKSSMVYRVFYETESFGSSKVANNLKESLYSIPDASLFSVYRDIIQGVLETAELESNILSTTYCIYAKTTIEKDDLVQNVKKLLNIFTVEDTIYREVYTLSYDEILEFYRVHFKLDMFDVGALRVINASTKNQTYDLKVLKVQGKSGKVYNTSDMDKFNERLLNDYGLKQETRSEG